MKRGIGLAACLIFIGTNAQKENSIVDQIYTSITIEPEKVKPQIIPIIVIHHAGSLSQQPSFLASFQKFLRQFTILLTNARVQTNIKLVEAMMISLIKTAIQIIRTQDLHRDESYEEIVHKLDIITPSMKRSLKSVIIKGNESIPYTKGLHGEKCQCKASDVSTKIILAFFANIAQNFFNILQDPNNAENVTPNLMGMLAGIVGIGNEVMKKGIVSDEQSIDTDITKHVRTLNMQSKEHIDALLHNCNTLPSQ